MAGTIKGGIKAYKKVKERYGKSWFKKIGKMGGKISRGGGFADKRVGKDGLTGHQRARIAGAKGGRISKRKKKNARN